MRLAATLVFLILATSSANAQTPSAAPRTLSCQQDSCSFSCVAPGNPGTTIGLGRVVSVTITPRGSTTHLDVRRTSPNDGGALTDFFIIGDNHACHFSGMS
jgi:hypothetical protein